MEQKSGREDGGANQTDGVFPLDVTPNFHRALKAWSHLIHAELGMVRVFLTV